jgi:hypothetical protein
MPPIIYFHKDVKYVVTNILLILRTIELCIFTSVSISGGQLISMLSVR